VKVGVYIILNKWWKEIVLAPTHLPVDIDMIHGLKIEVID
jgi:hypothetical protein